MRWAAHSIVDAVGAGGCRQDPTRRAGGQHRPPPVRRRHPVRRPHDDRGIAHRGRCRARRAARAAGQRGVDGRHAAPGRAVVAHPARPRQLRARARRRAHGRRPDRRRQPGDPRAVHVPGAVGAGGRGHDARGAARRGRRRPTVASRVAEVRPEFRITASTGDAVRRICADTDGLPYAIELAAAQVVVEGVEAAAAPRPTLGLDGRLARSLDHARRVGVGVAHAARRVRRSVQP